MPSFPLVCSSSEIWIEFPVSAASICAKVLRDKEMEHYIFEEDMSEEEDRAYGSGYLAGTGSWVQI